MSQESGVLLAELEVYFRLLWLFVGIISFLLLSLCYFYLAMRRAQARERVSLEFSRDFIEVRTMRARAEILGGCLDFISEVGNGLMVRIAGQRRLLAPTAEAIAFGVAPATTSGNGGPPKSPVC
jgi:hypothetical protein